MKSQKTAKLTDKNLVHKELSLDAIYNMDCIAGMAMLPRACVDLIITDPPFAIDFKSKRSNYNRKCTRVIDGYNEVAVKDYGDFTKRWMTEAVRIMKDSASMYVFSGWNNLKDILITIDELGLTTFNHIIWKYQFGFVTSRKFVTSHYHCLYVCKNESLRKFFPYSRFGKEEDDKNGGSLHYKDKEDVWIIKRKYWAGDQKTPTKLPVSLLKKC